MISERVSRDYAHPSMRFFAIAECLYMWETPGPRSDEVPPGRILNVVEIGMVFATRFAKPRKRIATLWY